MKGILSTLMAAVLLFSATISFASAADVYVTQNGKKYHTADCRWVKGRETVKMSEDEAIKKGYQPCGQCIEKEGSKKEEKK
jgi:hypothetical protein